MPAHPELADLSKNSSIVVNTPTKATAGTCVLMPDGQRLVMGSGRDDAEGNPAPSLKLGRYGFHRFRLAVETGARQVSVQVKQPTAAAERPYLRVRANPDIGIASAQTATADAGTGWQTLTVSFTATADGGIVVEIWNADLGSPCWFDNLSIT